MPTGDKSKYTDKQKRQAEHIEDSYREKGVGEERSERIAWSTVNKQTGGGKKPGGSGSAAATKSAPANKAMGGRKAYSSRSRSEAARKGWETRRRNANQR